VKGIAFSRLFGFQKPLLEEKIKKHHFKNSGISRYEKIPLYLSWSDIEVDKQNLFAFAEKFSKEVVDLVVESEWVLGVKSFIRDKSDSHLNIIVSATPQQEIEDILERLNIRKNFIKIYGYPISKEQAVIDCLNELNINPDEACYFGDAKSDLVAARNCNVMFFLRRTKYNSFLEALSENVIGDFQ